MFFFFSLFLFPFALRQEEEQDEQGIVRLTEALLGGVPSLVHNV